MQADYPIINFIIIGVFDKVLSLLDIIMHTGQMATIYGNNFRQMY